MSNARKAVLQVLNHEWSRGVWKHWLSNVFLPAVDPPMPAPVPAAPVPVVTLAEETVNMAPAMTSDGRSGLGAACAQSKSEPPGPTARGSKLTRRFELRARFDALSDRLMTLEEGLDTLLRRSSQRDHADRRSESRRSEVLENVAILAERQASVLEGLLGTVSRLEHALSRLEHGLSRVERALGDRNRRDSQAPIASAPPFASEHDSRQPPSRQRMTPQIDESTRERAPASARSSDIVDSDPTEGSSINGFLSEVSLSTVLAMLEIERRTGRLKVLTDDGLLASFELADGSVTSSRLSDTDADPLQALRSALCWKKGRFWFRQHQSEAANYEPRSIGSLLLEATRQNDESFAGMANG